MKTYAKTSPSERPARRSAGIQDDLRDLFVVHEEVVKVHATTLLSLLVVTNWALLFVILRRNVAIGRKLTTTETRHAEIVRRLGRSHLAAVRLLGACSPEQAQRISPECAASRQELAIAVAAVGELAEDREGPVSNT